MIPQSLPVQTRATAPRHIVPAGDKEYVHLIVTAIIRNLFKDVDGLDP